MFLKSDNQQCSLSATIKSETIIFPGQGTKPASLQIMQNYGKSQAKKKTQKLQDENISPKNITKRIVIQFLVPFLQNCIVLCAQFCPTIKPCKLVVPELTTSNREHCWWSLFVVDWNYAHDVDWNYVSVAQRNHTKIHSNIACKKSLRTNMDFEHGGIFVRTVFLWSTPEQTIE